MSNELKPCRNPWPEDSDYGKLWRKGYRAGKSDAIARLTPALIRIAERTRSA
jgi:hypothetical protein